jgi:large subunit ribosomal protein L22
MEYSAVHRYARIAPRKARLVADMIRGMRIDRALTALSFCDRRGASFFREVLRSAVANAEEKDAEVTTLYVAESRVDEGPVLKRFQPKDRGRAHPYKKRMSHLHVRLEERS